MNLAQTPILMTLFFLLFSAEKGLAQSPDLLLPRLKVGLVTTSCECLAKPAATAELRSCNALSRLRFERMGASGGTWTYASPWGAMATDLARPIWFYSETKEVSNTTIETITSARATKDAIVNRREVIEKYPNGLTLKATKHFQVSSADSRNYEFVYESTNSREQSGRTATLITAKVVCKMVSF